MRYDTEHRLAAVIGAFLPPAPRGILEIGCGDGDLSVQLARHSTRYVAIDPDGEAIRKAQSRGGHADFRIGSGEALAFPDASFDAVLFVLSLHHQDSRIALQEAHRVLVEGGVLIVLEPSPEGELQSFFHLFHDESEALAKAAAALEQGPFRLVEHRMIEAMAEFDDLEDLCAYPFDRAVVNDRDRALILDRFQALRGPVREGEAISLRDTMHWYVLDRDGLGGLRPPSRLPADP